MIIWTSCIACFICSLNLETMAAFAKLEYDVELVQLDQSPVSILPDMLYHPLLVNVNVVDWLLVGLLGPDETTVTGQLCHLPARGKLLLRIVISSVL